MSRVLAVQVRRFGLPGATVLLVAGATLLYAVRWEWAAGWMSLVTSQRSYLMLSCPVAIGVGAWLARREHRAGVAELFAGTPRPRRQRVLLSMAAVAGAVGVAQVAVLVVTGLWIASTARYLPGEAVAAAGVGVLAVITSAWIGMALGRLAPTAVTAPVLAVAGFGAMLALPMAFHEDRLSTLASPAWGMNQFIEYQTVPLRASAAQAVLAAGVAVAAVVLLAAGRWRTRAAALLPLVLGVALGVAVMPRDYDRVTIDPVAQQQVCTGDAPRVCVARVHAGLLDEVTPYAREALALLAKLPDPPTSAVENTNVYLDEKSVIRYGADTVPFDVRVGDDGHVEHPEFVLTRMLESGGATSAGCPDGFDVPAAMAAGAWLSGRRPVRDPDAGGYVVEPGETPPPSDEVEAARLWEGLRELPEAEALARVVAVRQAALTCGDTRGVLERGVR
ncbi:hypothetical protein Aph02nite_33490 [Actinoplanes philippinensis]|uniref:ABC-type transport system involved in multi-copper enzyme maturation, permease component n=1 Tax=Actinoplanes philippinensis TaxID=35752 RepID=A0A1I2DYV7_9ACTN|nr:hypothetical protein [Actinoplanes philippinensis]GIE77399.1 hypothetical protein Aph02nite_33490 [Actinoplanes philippinensis]SFE85443.1 hypothetical protein SAMN05421541_10454 [Actinoplanes philippinensis]